MRFDKIIPADILKPYIRYWAIAESTQEQTYRVFPTTGMVMGFQYRGRLAVMEKGMEIPLAAAGITGISDTFKVFRNAPGTGTILVYFTETGWASFSRCPANELFNRSVALDNLFDRDKLGETEEKLSAAATDAQRIKIVESFCVSLLKEIQDDPLVAEAVKLIYLHRGTIKIGELHEKLHISQSRLEKRFRRLVGTSPKKFASVVRFNTVLNSLHSGKPLTEIGYENNYFDQAHFIKDFRRFTGETPENFKRLL